MDTIMEHDAETSRRRFFRNSALALALPVIPIHAWAQLNLKQRLEWQFFTSTTQYDSLLGTIASMKANTPLDPILCLHHASLDRLWLAWCAAGGGRKMGPARNNGWPGNPVYTNTLSAQKKPIYDTQNNVQYSYQNTTLPALISRAQLAVKNSFKVQATPDQRMKSLPPAATFKITGPHATSDTTFSLGGALDIGLDERGVSARFPVSAEALGALQNIMNNKPASLPGNTKTYKAAQVVLDDVEVTDTGKKGGYFYQVYLSFPSPDGKTLTSPILIGTLGAFQIAGATQHSNGPVQLRYRLEQGMSGMGQARTGMVSVSFARIDGEHSPSGAVIGIGEARLEVATDATSP